MLASHLAKESGERENEVEDTIEPQNLENLEKPSCNFLFMLKKITSRKYIAKISLLFPSNFKINTVFLFDTGADLNYMKTRLVPKYLQEKTSEKLSTANNLSMKIKGKAYASISNGNLLIKTFF